MKTQVQQGNNGNTLICALCTIVIISLIGANVLVNCTRHTILRPSNSKHGRKRFTRRKRAATRVSTKCEKRSTQVACLLPPTGGPLRRGRLQLPGPPGPKPSVASDRQAAFLLP